MVGVRAHRSQKGPRNTRQYHLTLLVVTGAFATFTAFAALRRKLLLLSLASHADPHAGHTFCLRLIPRNRAPSKIRRVKSGQRRGESSNVPTNPSSGRRCSVCQTLVQDLWLRNSGQQKWSPALAYDNVAESIEVIRREISSKPRKDHCSGLCSAGCVSHGT